MIAMRFGLFLRVPWWLMLFVLICELAGWIVALPFIGLWKLYDWHLARSDARSLGITRVKPVRTRPGMIGAYRDWMDRNDPALRDRF